MGLSLQRGLPAGGPLALAGALLALVALGLPWLSEAVPGEGTMLGYQDQVLWVGLRVVAAVAAAVLTLRVVAIEHERETLRVVYAAAAVVVVIRAIHWLIVTAGNTDITLPGLRPIEAQGPMWGLFVSFLASGLFVAAAMAQHRAPAEPASAGAGATAAAEATPTQAPAVLDPDLAAFASPGPVAPAPPAPVAPVAAAPAIPATAPPVTSVADGAPAAPATAPPFPPAAPVTASPVAPVPPRSPAPAPAEAAPGERRSVAPPGFA